MIFRSFRGAIEWAFQDLKVQGQPIRITNWQGMSINEEMIETYNLNLEVMHIPTNLIDLQNQIQPDLPWADNHFEERVSRKPLNPGNEYRNWKFFRNNAEDEKFRKEGGKFSHTYMERYWPKRAGHRELVTSGGTFFGIRYDYGDLDDVINLLLDEPYTRQAYLPVWFPEDTGAVSKQRVPCTLGYLLYYRQEKLHITYYIRACDAFKHFRNDIYLTVRLLQWVLNELCMRQSHESKIDWHNVKLGTFNMVIANFHVFKKEINLLK